jgi:hypothetical protein
MILEDFPRKNQYYRFSSRKFWLGPCKPSDDIWFGKKEKQQQTIYLPFILWLSSLIGSLLTQKYLSIQVLF